MKIIVFGAGENARRFIRLNPAAEKIQIVGIVDNDSQRWGEKFEEIYTIESPDVIRSRDWEKIAVTPSFFWVIEQQLMTEYGIEKSKIIRSSDLIVPGRANLGSIHVSCADDDCYVANDLDRKSVV